GIVLLVGSALGAGWFLNQSPGDDSYNHPSRDRNSPPPPSVVCIGFVYNDPDVVNLNPLQPGRIVEVAKEGSAVTKGQPLLKLDDHLAQFKLREAKADLDSAKQQLEEAKNLPEQHKRLIKQQEDVIEAAKQTKEAAVQELQVKERLLDDKVKLNESIRKLYEAQIKKAEAGVKIEESKLEQLLKAPDPEIKVKMAQANVDAKQAAVDQAQFALDECTLAAPSDGTVLRVWVNPAELFAPNPHRPAAIQFAPKGKRIIRAEVLQEWASRVQAGQDVIIEDDTAAMTQWKGKVISVSGWFDQKRKRIFEPYMLNDVLTLECLIDIISDGRTPLLIGQRVRVTIKSKL
ncbi:MAG: biotin/lipoyl-binding protein, partial [Phycisphaerales bacterium]|nr:biotin/lipoyl-binding protein [Phycisphaerales bacterium]